MGLRRNRAAHDFSRAPQALIPRSRFFSQYPYKTTFNSGYLIPYFIEEILPGDTLSVNPTFFGRLLTPIVPFMDNLYFTWFYFFVPLRLVWDNFERQQGAQDNPGDSTDYLDPQIQLGTIPTTGLPVQSIYDYMGLPVQKAFPYTESQFTFSALPFRAYNLIWNEWFRDENLQDSAPFTKDDGPDNYNDYKLLKRGKRHDYFTSALPWPQKGPGVEIPLAGSAPVIGNGTTIGFTNGVNDAGFFSRNSGAGSGSGIVNYLSFGAFNQSFIGQPVGSPADTDTPANGFAGKSVGLSLDPTHSGMIADLTSVSAATINTLRIACQTQRLRERDARGGTRYTEILVSHFGVISPDARLQRPEYLGGGTTMISINPVAQTSSTDNTTPQGNMAAYGTMSAVNKGGFRKSFVEHGYVIGMFTVRADLTYQQGMSRMWQRHTRLDRYMPVFAHIGEQVVRNSEIYFDTDADWNNGVFGYQEAWAEYRYKPGLITGKFRSGIKNSSGANDSLDVWHLGQYFENRPVLNSEFIEENPPIRRVVAVTDENEPEFQLDSLTTMNFVRPMPMYSVPGLLDHF